MKKLSKEYTKKSRKKIYGLYVKYRIMQKCSFEEYCLLHEKKFKIDK